MNHWTIDEDHQVHPTDAVGWTEWHLATYADFERLRRVAWTQIDGDSWVSTVFIGIPAPFETYAIAGGNGRVMARYRTWDEAQAGHDRVVAAILGG